MLQTYVSNKTFGKNGIIMTDGRFTALFSKCNNLSYYISKLVRALWLVNLAGRTLRHSPLKFKGFLLPNCCVIYHQIFSTYIASKSLKLSFTLNCILKRANDSKTISNWLVLLSTCFRNLKLFLMNSTLDARGLLARQRQGATRLRGLAAQ